MMPHGRLTVMRDTLRLEGLGRRASQVDVSRPYRATEELPAAVASALNDLGVRRPRVEIRLARPLVQIRHLTGFPPVRRTRLVQLVGDRASAIFRRRDGALVLDARWRNRRGDDLIAAAASEDVVNTVVSAADGVGASVTAVRPADGAAGDGLSLLPPAARTRARQRRRRAVLAAALAAVGSWSLAGGVYLWDLIGDHRTITADVRALEEPVARLSEAREQVNQVAAMVRAVRRDVDRRGWPIAAVESLTTLLPDSAYLTRLLIAVDGRYELSGLAAFPDSVLESLVSASWRVDPAVSHSRAGGNAPERDGWRPFHVVIPEANGDVR